MSLHTLANHMAATGRGPDSTLVHMSPREVQGLQALAMANGGSLTINPQTGLPEAGFLDSLLPALAGFALNAFAPGVGGAIGSALGFGAEAASTVGTGLLVGGATGLATGSLEKGLMAGLGAYGGAGLESGLNAAGKSALETASSAGAGHGAFLPGAESAPSSTLDRLQAGLGAYGKAPYDALKDNAMNIGLASAPLISGAFDNQTSTAPKIHPGYIRGYDRDPVTGTLYQTSATPADQYTGGIKFGGVPEVQGYPKIQGYAQGGIPTGIITTPEDPLYSVAAPDNSEVVDTTAKTIKFGGVPELDLTGRDMSDKRSDSEKVQDYLMGKGPNPFLFYHKTSTVDPVAKAAEATKEIAKVVEEQRRGGSGGDATNINTIGNASPWGTVTDVGLLAANSGIPGLVSVGDRMLSAAEAAKGNTAMARNTVQDPAQRKQAYMQDMVNQYGQYNNPIAGFQNVQEGSNIGTNSQPNPISGYSIGPSAAPEAANPMSRDQAQREGQDSGVGISDRTLADHISGQDAAGRDRDARGGFLNHGQFDQRYAYGGGIAALADGGMYNLGSYSDGGRLLRGPGDGVSDDIPATIGENQPARLADGEFVVPARIVSEIGNGSTEAGARKLYAMMDRVQKSRSKTTGKDKVAANTRADKYLPA